MGRHRNQKYAGTIGEAVMRSRVAVVAELLLGCGAIHKRRHAGSR
jgi:hypothetical protein